MPTQTRPAAPAPAESPEFERRIAELARTPVLLVASDYDGTMAPIVEDPSEARPDRDAMVAIRRLAALPSTHAAIISGRALSDLAVLTGEPENVRLIGSHGSEFDLDFATSLPPAAAALRERLIREVAALADESAGFLCEVKPASVAFHYRNADEGRASGLVERLLNGPGHWDGVHIKLGKMVVELAVVATSKGTALDACRQQAGATGVLFLGDDRTDEDAFARLWSGDVGIKVGEGESAAGFRVSSPRDVARVLARLSELRSTWLAGAEATPIADHALLSDLRTAALVTPDARVVWMCVPRIDSPALFAELVGGPVAGRFSVSPVRPAGPPVQSYEGNSFHVRTQWPRVTVTDYLDCSGGRTMQRAGRTDLVRTIEGRARVRIEFAPRLDFGRVATRLEVIPDGLRVLDTVDPIVLRARGVEWQLRDEGPHHTAVAELDLAGEPLTLELRYGTGSVGPGIVDESRRSEQTRRYWASWAAQLEIPPVRPELVRRSALVLRALSHGPTGAIVAAATTSLPESLGGVRNWDYRFCWPRDASLSASALVRLGSTGEALRLLDWMLGVVDTLPAPDRVRPIYTVSGQELGIEGEIPELSGYAGSRPVRVGNGAAGQLQLDVFGPVMELIWLLVRRGAPMSNEHWRLVEAIVNAVESRWQDADHGIWEIRGPMRHHVHSKVMCWQTADLGCRIAEEMIGRTRHDWARLRDRIGEEVLDRGWSEAMGSFTSAYATETVDASVLHVGLSGLLPPDDPRFAGTVRAVERTLLRNGTVYRYLEDDGLPGAEGGFHLCTTWLIEAYLLAGRTDEARRLFDAYCSSVGGTGLLCEEVDPDTGLGLGNHPQAYSHLGLINAAVRLASAER